MWLLKSSTSEVRVFKDFVGGKVLVVFDGFTWSLWWPGAGDH